MSEARILVWFRNNLRTHDNEALYRAAQKSRNVLPVFVFDERVFQTHSLGFPRSGFFRTSFLIEAVHALRSKLRSLGSDLIVRVGLPEFEVAKLATEYDVHEVFTSWAAGTEEATIANALEKQLALRKISLQIFWTNTLYHYEDIPWPIQHLPGIFTKFRKELETESSVRPLFDDVTALHFAEEVDPGVIPGPDSFALQPMAKDVRSVVTYRGGEAEALNRMRQYIWEKDLLRTYKETRNQLLGPDYSSKLSAALALGCISPRIIYYEVKKYETDRESNDSTYWLIFELMWRDYFQFVAKKYCAKVFAAKGLQGKPVKWLHDEEAFSSWREGRTGVNFVDANMRELLLTGYMSNRGRQNVASYLTKDLNIDWRWGAAWFESQLVDYDVASNWLNWQYVAGVGNDPRADRYFNIESQVRKYDSRGEYQQYWLG